MSTDDLHASGDAKDVTVSRRSTFHRRASVDVFEEALHPFRVGKQPVPIAASMSAKTEPTVSGRVIPTMIEKQPTNPP